MNVTRLTVAQRGRAGATEQLYKPRGNIPDKWLISLLIINFSPLAFLACYFALELFFAAHIKFITVVLTGKSH